jgi:hypothetical protein
MRILANMRKLVAMDLEDASYSKLKGISVLATSVAQLVLSLHLVIFYLFCQDTSK